jgi:L-threonylcarbamoyladenylate synthase
MIYLKLNKNNINEIAEKTVEVIRSGEIAVVPFDTVYGFITDPKNNFALEKIFSLKDREINKTVGIAISSPKELGKIAVLDDFNFINKKVPGPYTFILSSQKKDFSRYCYNDSTIAIRIPDNKLILKVTKIFGPIAQTSANKSGQLDCFSVEEINEQFSPYELNKVSLVVDGGKIESNGSSQIWDLTGSKPKKIER